MMLPPVCEYVPTVVNVPELAMLPSAPAPPPYCTIVLVNLITAFVKQSTDDQSPGVGDEAAPSPLVSPSTVSSFSDVRCTGAVAVPCVCNPPRTSRTEFDESNLTAVSAARMRVSSTVTEFTTYGKPGCADHVTWWPTAPPSVPFT